MRELPPSTLSGTRAGANRPTGALPGLRTALIVLALVGPGCHAQPSAVTPKQAVDAYAAAVREKRYEDAYAMLSREARRELSLEEFERRLAESPEETALLLDGLGASSEEATVRAVITGKNGETLELVYEGDAWRVEGAQLAGLNRFIEAIDFKIEKNRLQCALATLTPEKATITLQWSVSGEMSRNAAVLEFSGEMTYDRKTRMITAFQLKGGRQSQGGPRQQISIEITRRPITSWLDLDD